MKPSAALLAAGLLLAAAALSTGQAVERGAAGAPAAELTGRGTVYTATLSGQNGVSWGYSVVVGWWRACGGGSSAAGLTTRSSPTRPPAPPALQVPPLNSPASGTFSMRCSENPGNHALDECSWCGQQQNRRRRRLAALAPARLDSRGSWRPLIARLPCSDAGTGPWT